MNPFLFLLVASKVPKPTAAEEKECVRDEHLATMTQIVLENHLRVEGLKAGAIETEQLLTKTNVIHILHKV